jgi:hypothetical protein
VLYPSANLDKTYFGFFSHGIGGQNSYSKHNFYLLRVEVQLQWCLQNPIIFLFTADIVGRAIIIMLKPAEE